MEIRRPSNVDAMPLDADDGAELLLKDMAACAGWKQHFRRIG